MVVVVLMIVGFAVGVGVAADDPPPDPAAQLADAQAAVEDTSSFRFSFVGESTDVTGDEESGTETTVHYSGEGRWTEDLWQLQVDDGFGVTETILDGSTSYDRFGEDAGDLADQQWTEWEDMPDRSEEDLLDELEYLSEDDADLFGLSEDEYADASAVSAAEMLVLGGSPGGMSMGFGFTSGSGAAISPDRLLDAIDEIADPTQAEEEDDVTTVSATVVADEEYEDAFGSSIPDAQVELDVGPDDRPLALRFSVARGDSSSDVEVSFSGWNADVEIEVPSGDEVDRTPWLDEEGLRAIEDVELVWPTEIPRGWELTTWSPAEQEEFGETECEQVGLDWDESLDDFASDDDYEDAGYLYLVLRTVDCALEEDDTPFAPDGPGGLPHRESDLGDEVQVGNTAVSIDTSLSDEELAPILASFVPIDVETLIDEAN